MIIFTLQSLLSKPTGFYRCGLHSRYLLASENLCRGPFADHFRNSRRASTSNRRTAFLSRNRTISITNVGSRSIPRLQIVNCVVTDSILTYMFNDVCQQDISVVPILQDLMEDL